MPISKKRRRSLGASFNFNFLKSPGTNIICSKRKQKIANFVTRIFVEKIDLFHTSFHSKIHRVEYLDKTFEKFRGIHHKHSYPTHSLMSHEIKTVQLKTNKKLQYITSKLSWLARTYTLANNEFSFFSTKYEILWKK